MTFTFKYLIALKLNKGAFYMICVYCGKGSKGTKEHIISSGILDLFPECFLTIDGERHVVHQRDPMINDVCADCNNHKISYIDTYAKNFIERYFLKKYKKDDILSIEYNYALLQKMCLKYAFNDLRSRKKNVSFFDDEIKTFLLTESETIPLKNITILAGLAINTSPVPDYMFGNMKLMWSDSPLLLSNSIVTNIDYYTGNITFCEKLELMKFKQCALAYVFRFNSLQILMFCWEKNISDNNLFENNVILEHQYPYHTLNTSGQTTLSRCTSEITYHYPKLIDVSWGQSLFDSISELRGTFSENYQQLSAGIEKLWAAEEKNLAKKHPR